MELVPSLTGEDLSEDGGRFGKQPPDNVLMLPQASWCPELGAVPDVPEVFVCVPDVVTRRWVAQYCAETGLPVEYVLARALGIGTTAIALAVVASAQDQGARVAVNFDGQVLRLEAVLLPREDENQTLLFE